MLTRDPCFRNSSNNINIITLPIVRCHQHFPDQMLANLSKQRLLQNTPHLVPMSQRFSWCGGQPNVFLVSRKAYVEPESEAVDQVRASQ